MGSPCGMVDGDSVTQVTPTPQADTLVQGFASDIDILELQLKAFRVRHVFLKTEAFLGVTFFQN